MISDQRTDENVWWHWGTFCDRFGPLRAGQLVSLLASTGTGKTTFVTNATTGWLAQGLNLALISTEMSSDELREKMAGAEAGIPERWLACGDWSKVTPEQRAAFLAAHHRFTTVPILGLESFGEKTVETLQTTIAGTLGWFERRDRRLQVLIVDHLHELTPRPGETQLEAWANAVLMLRDMAARERVAVLLVVQPRRPDRQTIPAMYRCPDVHDARGVAQVETCSHQIYGLRRCLTLEGMGPKARRDAVAEIAANRKTVHDYAIPRSEVRCLKHRRLGSAVNRAAVLRLEDGRLVDPEHEALPF